MPAASRTGSRRAHAVAAATSLLLLGGLALPAYAAAPAAPAADPGPSGPPEQAAEQALENAQQALAGDGQLEPTIALAELAPLVDELDGEDRRQADALLARPTDEAGGDGTLDYGSRTVRTRCTVDFCVNYVSAGVHAAGTAYVDQVGAAVQRSWDTETGTLGYREPLRDRGPRKGEGDDPLLDVYLGDVGGLGVFGYAAPDRPNQPTSSAYLVLDNDYAEFRGKPLELMRVTAAHELFHAVQFAYDLPEDPWLKEATATWVEEQVYDGIDDNRNYLGQGSLRQPGQPLDALAGWYGNWIFFQYLAQEHGPVVVREIWERAVVDGVYSTKAVNRALAGRGSSLAAAFAAFSLANNAPTRSYEEGSAYRAAPVARSWKLGTARRGTGGWQSTSIRHLASRNHRFVPDASLTGRWELRVRVDGPDGVTRASVMIHRSDGALRTQTVRLGLRGNGTLRVGFTPGKVRKVSVNLANTSVSYRCDTGGGYACDGTPRNDSRQFRFAAHAVR
jgi:hypothetical protein